ncbi:MAG: XdhC/CoxI family protein [Actinomycetota bacterium]
MREILDDIRRWREAGTAIAIARVVAVDGSGPREQGATMGVTTDGEVAGSVSGGCVESAVVTEALAVLSGETGAHVVTYGIADEDAIAVGLTCGGTIHVLVAKGDDEVLGPLEDALRNGRPVALATRVDGPDAGGQMLVDADGATLGTLGEADLDRVAGRDALAALRSSFSGTRHYGSRGEARKQDVEVLLESFAPPPRMVIFGAVDFTAALARAAKVLGYRVTVCDARETFATRQRFPMADEVVVDWPDRFLETIELGPRDAVCVLTHDHKFDVPAIVGSLRTGAGYIGAMGSRKTHDDRLRRLREAGVGDASMARVMSPIGLDIGARSPEEVAVAICAEIIALRTGAEVPFLRDAQGPIHPR